MFLWVSGSLVSCKHSKCKRSGGLSWQQWRCPTCCQLHIHTDLRPVKHSRPGILQSAEHWSTNWPWRRDMVCQRVTPVPRSTQHSQHTKTTWYTFDIWYIYKRVILVIINHWWLSRVARHAVAPKRFSSLADNVTTGLLSHSYLSS